MTLAKRSISPSIKDSVSAAEWQARVDLAAVYRLAVLLGWQEPHRVFNHMAARVPDAPDFMLCKPHDALYCEVTASNLIKIDLNGPELTFADNVNPSAFTIHGSVLRARPDVNASLHMHAAAGVALSSVEGGLKFFLQESMIFYDNIGYHKFEGVAADDEGDRMVRDLGQKEVLVLENHGLLVCASTIEKATLDMSDLILTCEIQLRAMATGAKLREIPDEVCAKTAKQWAGYTEHRIEWDAMMRYLDRHDSSYRD